METKITPGFASPDSKIPETLMKRSDEIRSSLFQIAEQNGVTAVKEQSGIAKEWDFQAHGFVLKETARISEEAERWISETFKLYTNETFVYTVEYRSDFQPRATLGQIQIFQGILDAVVPPKASAIAKKEMVLSAFHNKPIDELQEALDEIDAEATDAIEAKKNAPPTDNGQANTTDDEPGEGDAGGA